MKKVYCSVLSVLAVFFFISCGSGSVGSSGSETGTVEVELTYPSEYIPEMDVYLLNMDTRQMLRKRSIVNISPVTFDNVPLGRYVAYAITVEKLVAPEIGLGEVDYNAPQSKYESAIGGYTANYDDWQLLQFEVATGKTSVSVNDWDVNIPD